MKTEIKKGKQAIVEGAKLIKQGEVVVFPTETVYGLGACAFSEEAIKKIFKIKNRPMDNPLIVHIASKENINSYLVKSVNKTAQILIDNFMPGPITVVMKKSSKVPDIVTAGLDSVGIRMPSNEIASTFIKEAGCPIVAPSANLSTRISPTDAKQVFEQLNGKVKLIIDGGKCLVGIESTVVDATSEVPKILRPGAITPKMILEKVGAVETVKHVDDSRKVASPGMKYKHYAPQVDMVIAKDLKIMKDLYQKESKTKKVVLLVDETYKKELSSYNTLSLGKNIKEVAHNIYRAMAMAEKEYDLIISQYFKGDDLEQSVMNRILKAAGQKIF